MAKDEYVRRFPVRTFRIPDEEWRASAEVAKQRGETLSAVIRECLRRYREGHEK